MKTKTKEQKPEPLQLLIDRCQKEHGLKSAILNRYILQGGTGNWPSISRWLHPDPKERRKPRKNSMAKLVQIQKDMGKDGQP